MGCVQGKPINQYTVCAGGLKFDLERIGSIVGRNIIHTFG